MRKLSVLVTRPALVMGSLEKDLFDLGYDVFCEPFLSIERLVTPRPFVKGDFITVLTSQVAASLLCNQKYDWPELYLNPCFCVGQKTAEIAKQAGFINIVIGSGDGDGLVRGIAQAEPITKQALHICGQDTDRSLREGLLASRRSVLFWPIYRAIKKQEISLELKDRLLSHALDIVLFFSVRTAQAFCTALQKIQMEQTCRSMTVVALSPKVAQILSDLPWKKLAVAAQPDQTSVLRIMKDICSTSEG